MVNLALLILRAILGSLMLGHGAQKLFGWWGGYGLDGTSAWLESMGLRPGRPWAIMAGGSEFGGGVLFEIATDGPGFTSDEDAAHLGERLSLPPFLEGRREEIEARLEPLTAR